MQIRSSTERGADAATTWSKHVGIKELTPAIVNEFIKKIIVYAPDKSIGHRRWKIQIVWYFIVELQQSKDKQTIEREKKQNGLAHTIPPCNQD